MTNIFVNNNAELAAALKSATGGETIILNENAVKYSVALTNKTYSSEVKLVGATDNVVVETVRLENVSNVHLDGLHFDSAGTTRATWLSDVWVKGGSNISVTNSHFQGTATEFNDGTVTVGGIAIKFENTTGVTIDNNEISHYMRGTYVMGSRDVVVSNNELHAIQGDGMDFAGVKNVVVENNHLHDFIGSLFKYNHNDMIQFWTSGGWGPSDNVVIQNNFLDSGNGAWTQGIFFGNEAVDAGQGMSAYYTNIQILNNIVHNNAFYHGITVAGSIGTVIDGNGVFKNNDSEINNNEFNYHGIMIVLKKAIDAVVANNISDDYKFVESTGLTNTNNINIDYNNPASPYYVEKLFANALAGKDLTIGDLQILPESLLQLLGVGPDILQPPLHKDYVANANDITPSTPFVGTDLTDSLTFQDGGAVLTLGTEATAHYGIQSIEALRLEDGAYTVNVNASYASGLSGNVLHVDASDAASLVLNAKTPGNNKVAVDVTGSQNLDRLWGGDLADTLDGGRGDDRIEGRGGNDLIYGGDGNDFIQPGDGNDTIWGGNGNDTVYIWNKSGNDYFMDFGNGADIIDVRSHLNGTNIHDFASLKSHITQVGQDTVIDFGSTQNTITLVGIDAATLNASNFSFS